ncbi:MAG TPA: trypsin-like peptidase domain-containing protein [Chthoniobacteraceae bacterium]|nr:trypsin-like peptidase domain-containing protein [Chthoniobacteraceae bacterium]
MFRFPWKIALACLFCASAASLSAAMPSAEATPTPTPATDAVPVATPSPKPGSGATPPAGAMPSNTPPNAVTPVTTPPTGTTPVPTPAETAPPPPAPAPEAQHIRAAAVVRKSLVRITVTTQEANFRVPWFPGGTGGGIGAGFVIDGERILTNAHVISNAKYITVEKDNDPNTYTAHVQFVGHDCDLAILKIDDPNSSDFFKGTIPLEFGGLPEIESTVTVYGYPIGGERMSVTNGIVSRIDFQTYSHSGVDQHLTIQTSAAINPGNSGGPVLQDGKVVGVAFQGYGGDVAQNIGYMIPTSVVLRFLKDIESGTYNRYMDLSVTTFDLKNPAMRKALGLKPDGDDGIMVGMVAAKGSSDGILQVGDVLLAIDGHPIAKDGAVDLDDERIQMAEIVERKFKGDSVTMHILRDKKEMDVSIPLKVAWAYEMQANSYDVLPRYVMFCGLLFQPLSHDFMEANSIEDLRLRYYYEYFLSQQLYIEHPDVVVLSSILPDDINAYLGGFRDSIVDEVNGKKIKTLKDLSAAFAQSPAPDRFVIKVIGSGVPIVINGKDAADAQKRIMRNYHVTKAENLTETPED